MKDEIKLWKEKTKGLFNIVEWTRFWNYITNLQEENERLRKNQKLTPEQRNHLHLELDEVLEIYKSRNEKAIEYVKNLKNYRFEFTFDNVDRHEIVGCTHNFVKDLLNILQGGNK